MAPDPGVGTEHLQKLSFEGGVGGLWIAMAKSHGADARVTEVRAALALVEAHGCRATGVERYFGHREGYHVTGLVEKQWKTRQTFIENSMGHAGKYQPILLNKMLYDQYSLHPAHYNILRHSLELFQNLFSFIVIYDIR